jgi:hypothetical protein
MSTGSAILFTPGKSLMTGGWIITSVDHIHAELQTPAEFAAGWRNGNMKKNQPTLLTEGCI